MKLSKAINFLSGTVFQRISWRTFWHFLDSIFWASSLLISFSLAFVGFRFQFDFLFSFAVPPFPLHPSPPLCLAVSLSLFDLYSNYFHNEINRPFPGCLHLPGSAESTWASFRIVSSNLLLSLSPSFSLWLSLLLPAVQLLSESMTNRKSGSDLVQRLRRM